MTSIDADTVAERVRLVRERIRRLDEVGVMVEGFFVDEMSYDIDELLGKRFRDNASGALTALRQAGERLGNVAWEHAALEQAMRSLADEIELKAGDLFILLRVAVMGKPVSPPLFESMVVVGREKSLARIDRGIEILAKTVA